VAAVRTGTRRHPLFPQDRVKLGFMNLQRVLALGWALWHSGSRRSNVRSGHGSAVAPSRRIRAMARLYRRQADPHGFKSDRRFRGIRFRGHRATKR
jgi:hypothetical protein